MVVVVAFIFIRHWCRNSNSNNSESVKSGIGNTGDDKDMRSAETTQALQDLSTLRRNPQYLARIGLADGYTYEEPKTVRSAPGPQ